MNEAIKRIQYCFNNNLTHLDLSFLELIELPEILPSNLISLDCYYNNLIYLPKKLPESLQVLQCANNQLIKLPDEMPRLYACDFSNNPYMYISKDNAKKFGTTERPNYNEIIKPIQLMWIAKRRKRRLKWLRTLQDHINNYIYRPNGYEYQQMKIKYKGQFNDT